MLATLLATIAVPMVGEAVEADLKEMPASAALDKTKTHSHTKQRKKGRRRSKSPHS